MDHNNRIAQFYGYTVCLVAIITGLIVTSQTVTNLFTYASPLASNQVGYFDGGFSNASLTSFEAFQATQLPRPRRNSARPMPGMAPGGAPSNEAADSAETVGALRARYEALRADRITRVRFRAVQSLATEALLLIIAIVLFITHWRWLRRLPTGDHPATA